MKTFHRMLPQTAAHSSLTTSGTDPAFMSLYAGLGWSLASGRCCCAIDSHVHVVHFELGAKRDR